MIYIDTTNSISDRIEISDDKAITVSNIDVAYSDNWGDEDAIKMVSTVNACKIIIDPSVADKFSDTDGIGFIRWNYYRPAYYITGKNWHKKTLPNGGIEFTIAA